jgi:hypothetical protein
LTRGLAWVIDTSIIHPLRRVGIRAAADAAYPELPSSRCERTGQNTSRSPAASDATRHASEDPHGTPLGHVAISVLTSVLDGGLTALPCGPAILSSCAASSRRITRTSSRPLVTTRLHHGPDDRGVGRFADETTSAALDPSITTQPVRHGERRRRCRLRDLYLAAAGQSAQEPTPSTRPPSDRHPPVDPPFDALTAAEQLRDLVDPDGW